MGWSSTSGDLVPVWAFSAASAFVGVAACVLASFRRRALWQLVMVFVLIVPFGCSSWGLKEGLDYEAHVDALSVCGKARREGSASFGRDDARYARHLDRDRDGIACEFDGQIGPM
jgi:hypothetical protein